MELEDAKNAKVLALAANKILISVQAVKKAINFSINNASNVVKNVKSVKMDQMTYVQNAKMDTTCILTNTVLIVIIL